MTAVNDFLVKGRIEALLPLSLRLKRDTLGSMSHQPLHVPAGTSPRYGFREHTFRFLITGEQSGGSYSALEVVSPEGTGAGPHVHQDSEEHFVVLEGEVLFRVEDQEFHARKGDLIHVPRGAVHSFTVLTTESTSLATYTPAGEETAFIEQARPIDP